jgi:hypothetical protein
MREIAIEIVLGAVIVTAVALFAHRYPWYSAPPPPNVSTRDFGSPPLALVPIESVAELQVASSMSATSSAFGLPVRILTYRGDFIASNAVEEPDGRFYTTYYWDKGSTPYEADRFAMLTGGAIRELFAGNFLDEITIIGQSDGVLDFDVGMGSTVHESDLYGQWVLSDVGLRMVEGPTRGLEHVPARRCDWCYLPVSARTGESPFCSGFAGGALCDDGPGVTFRKHGTSTVIDRDAFLIGSGPDRFLLIERRPGSSPIYIEGFAASD